MFGMAAARGGSSVIFISPQEVNVIVAVASINVFPSKVTSIFDHLLQNRFIKFRSLHINNNMQS